MLSLPLALSLLLLPNLGSASTIHVPLTRRAEPATPHDLDYFGSAAAGLRSKYHFGAATTSGRRRAAPEGLPITNQDGDVSYLGTVNIGTPPQAFDVVLDTGSADLWVVDTACGSCPRSATAFNPGLSSTLQETSGSTVISYGSGAVGGSIARDVVNMGNFTVDRQTFMAADRLESGLLSGQTSGIMGLGFQAISATRSTPWWMNLLNTNQLEAPEFSFWMARSSGEPTRDGTEPGGVFTLGGTNSTLFSGEVEFLNLAGGSVPTYWLLPLTSVTVQGESVSVTTGNRALSAIDTGTTLIGGPSADVAKIWAAVPGASTQPTSQGLYTYPCRTQINVTLSFGGKSWPIDPRDMSLGAIGSSGLCAGAIFDLTAGSNIPVGSGNPSWVVGATFLKNVYSVYRADPPSVGFAELSTAAGGSGVAPGTRPSSDALSLNALASPLVLLFTMLVTSLYALV